MNTPLRIGALIDEPAGAGQGLCEGDALGLEADFLVLAGGAERRETQGLVQGGDHVARLQGDILLRVLNDGFERQRVHAHRRA